MKPFYFSSADTDGRITNFCFYFQEHIGTMARNLKALVTKHSFKERYKTAQTYLNKLKFLVEDVSPLSLRGRVRGQQLVPVGKSDGYN